MTTRRARARRQRRADLLFASGLLLVVTTLNVLAILACTALVLTGAVLVLEWWLGK